MTKQVTRLGPITATLLHTEGMLLITVRAVSSTIVLILYRIFPLLLRHFCLLKEFGDFQVNTRRKRTLRAYTRAVLIEEERNRREEKRNASEQRGGPVDTQVLKHLRREKWERRTGRRADDRMARERGRRVHEVRVYQVALSTSAPHPRELMRREWTVGKKKKTHDEGYEYKRDCQPDEDRAQSGNPPGHGFVVPAPAEPKDADH